MNREKGTSATFSANLLICMNERATYTNNSGNHDKTTSTQILKRTASYNIYTSRYTAVDIAKTL